jgi:hypothetical protein
VVPQPRELEVARRAGEMFSQGYSINDIRLYLTYECNIKNRSGREHANAEVHEIVQRGMQLRRSEAGATQPALALVPDRGAV